MPCSGLNAAKKPCGIATKNKYCHIHLGQFLKTQKDAKLAHRVGEQKKALGQLNILVNTMKSDLTKEKSEKAEALKENERLKKELLMLKDENAALKEKTYKLKREVKDARLTMKSNTQVESQVAELRLCLKSERQLNQRLKARVKELEDAADQMEAMRADYEAYQTIKHFEFIHHQMMTLYNQTNSIGVIKAMKRSPKMAEAILGYKPWNKYNKMKEERNALAHVI